MKIFPNSGASVCIAGIKHIKRLNCDVRNLRQNNTRITAVGGTKLKCHGWLPVEFKIKKYKTTQPLYICDDIDRIYFSKEEGIDTHI